MVSQSLFKFQHELHIAVIQELV
uniref:Uncharacterized protein n=1 Tax=Rhizophora mucronata TaxID=61149 RepID=A0A2P2N4X3_RHIMU